MQFYQISVNYIYIIDIIFKCITIFNVIIIKYIYFIKYLNEIMNTYLIVDVILYNEFVILVIYKFVIPIGVYGR